MKIAFDEIMFDEMMFDERGYHQIFNMKNKSTYPKQSSSVLFSNLLIPQFLETFSK
jgi:hypothetical protein